MNEYPPKSSDRVAGELTAKETAAFQGDGIEHTFVTARLIATAVRIEIDVSHRLCNAEATADK